MKTKESEQKANPLTDNVKITTLARESEQKAAWTPGPWHAAGSYIVAQRNPGGIKHHIAEASRDQPSAICLANARLIAAAPELYEACEKILSLHDDAVFVSGDDDAGKVDDSLASIRAALAKARP